MSTQKSKVKNQKYNLKLKSFEFLLVSLWEIYRRYDNFDFLLLTFDLIYLLTFGFWNLFMELFPAKGGSPPAVGQAPLAEEIGIYLGFRV